MNSPTVSLVTVTFNSAEELPGLLSSISSAGDLFGEVVAVDNASDDGSADMFGQATDKARVIRNSENVGFAAAVNEGLRATSSDFVLLVNPDVSFGPEFVERLAGALMDNPQAGSAAPLLMRPDGVTVDSAGLVLHRNRKAKDRGQDRPLTSGLMRRGRVFGPCGAAAMYRRSALEDAGVDGEVFDESFFAYKEDVDLAWRMNLLGWDALYVPEAVGTHARGWKTASRKDMPKSIRRQSHMNRYLCIIKNDDVSNVLLHLPWVLTYEAALLTFMLFIEVFLFSAWGGIIDQLPSVLLKRRKIMVKRKRSPSEMRRLIGM